jgi:N-acyl-L-homoserine lactone synthetase
LLLNGVVTQAKSQGATEIMALCPPVFARTMRQLGFPVHVIGDPYVNMHDNRKYVAMKGKLDGVTWQNPNTTAPAFAVAPEAIAAE